MNYHIYYNRETGKRVQTIVGATAVPSMQDVVCFQELYDDYGFFVMSRDEFLSKFTREFEGIGITAHLELERRAELPQKTRRIEQKKMDEEMEEKGNPLLLKFLDAETYREKIKVLFQNRELFNDTLLETIAVCLDLTLEEGVDKFEFIVQHLELQQKYENNRLR